MKKIISIRTIVALFVTTSVLSASAQTTSVASPTTQGQMYNDAETLAQGFLLTTSDHYIAYLNSWNNNSSYSLNMLLDKNLFITNMTANSTNIPLPKPLGGIPIPASGYQNVNIQIMAVDKYGNQGAVGQFYTNFLAQGSAISISMTPQFPPVAIQIGKGLDSSSMTVNIIGSNGWGWSYDPKTGLLTISIYDPISTDIQYSVTDGSGGLLAHGSLPFFQISPGSGTGTNSVFDLHNDGNVVTLSLGSNGYNYINNAAFDSTVQRNGVYVPAKVITVDDIANQSKLYLYSYNLNGATVEVRQWTSSGVMQLVPCTVTTDGYGGTTIISSQYLDKAVITVLPGKDAMAKFYLYVGRTY